MATVKVRPDGVGCLALALIVGCGVGPREQPGHGPPTLVETRSFTLTEPDSLYLGQPGTFAFDRHGRLLVIDRFARRVIRFDRRHHPDLVYGRAGRGPGEFLGPLLILFPDDSTVAVSEFAGQRIEFFDLETATPVRRLRVDGFLTSAAAGARDTWLGLYSAARRTGVSRWRGRDSIVPVVPIPETYLPGSRTLASEVGVRVGAAGDTLLVAFDAVAPIAVVDTTGRLLDSVEIPAVRRRGVPPIAVLERLGVEDFPKKVASRSVLFHMHRRSDGAFILVHYDQTYVRRAFLARIYVSLLSPDLDSACVDAEIPVSGEIRALVHARGDTLFVLDQRTAGEQRLLTTVTGYLIDDRSCTWLPTRRVSRRDS